MEQLPLESAKAFEAFQLYANLGPQRSHSRVAEQLEKSQRLIEGWSTDYQWVARAAAWDRTQADWDRKQKEARKAAEQADIEATRQRHKKLAQLGRWDEEAGLSGIALRFPLDRT